MDHFEMLLTTMISFFIVNITGLGGLYMWSSKQFSHLYEIINDHHQNHVIHTDTTHLVSRELCSALHTAQSKSIQTQGEDIKEMKSDIKTLLSRKAG